MIAEFAPAKINLALHVTGRRDDGYHLLDSLVVFATVGDRLEFASDKEDRLTIFGRFAASLPTDAVGTGQNLVVRARDALRAWAETKNLPTPPVGIRLKKNLPVASGIGGGSADAAATLRGLDRLWDLGVPRADLHAMALKLGADVPMCVESRSLVARGIGEEIALLEDVPELFLLLVNPLAEVPTPSVFRALSRRDNPPLDLPEEGAPLEQWLGTLAASRNDLQAAAESLEPRITQALELIREADPMLARMSGSGATCFGIYRSQAGLDRALAKLEAERPAWYIAGAGIHRPTADAQP
jgi:4-diphosphocytidyl-2-C-methyl-D-erythritol kinase